MNFKRMLRQKLMYWATPVPDGMGGHTYTAPVELICRWEDKAEMFFTPEGRQEVSRSVVWLQDAVAVAGWLWLGSETELEDAYASTADPMLIDGAAKIRSTGQVPDVRGKQPIHQAYL